jgi:hypothetical protein
MEICIPAKPAQHSQPSSAQLAQHNLRSTADPAQRSTQMDQANQTRPIASVGDLRAATRTALVEFITADLSPAAELAGKALQPVNLLALTNRDVLVVVVAVRKQHSLCLEDIVPGQLKSLMYERLCCCFPALRLAANNAKTFFAGS